MVFFDVVALSSGKPGVLEVGVKLESMLASKYAFLARRIVAVAIGIVLREGEYNRLLSSLS